MTGMIIVVALVNICFSQSYWQRTYGGDGETNISAMTPSHDGNYLCAGYTSATSSGPRDGWLLKIKPDGDTLWTKTYFESADDRLQAICPISDGNFLLVGTTYTFGAGESDGWLITINQYGETLWLIPFGGSEADYLNSILPTADGNFLLGGKRATEGWLIKVTMDGDTLWTKSYGGIYRNFFRKICPAENGNFLCVGADEQPPDKKFADGWLVKIKPDGDTLWTKMYGGSDREFLNTIIPAADGNFLLGGMSWTFGTGTQNAWLVKINSDGDTLWTKAYGEGDYSEVYVICPTADGNFLLGGDTQFPNERESVGWLIKIKPNGDTLWTKTFGRRNGGSLAAIIPTADGNILCGGCYYDLRYQNAWIICIIADQYACKDSLFSFKIPTYGIDSLNFVYTPLKVPSGMTVSPGGTISWTPETDSAYMEHVEYLVENDTGRIDTLTFNIFVNDCFNTPIKPPTFTKNISKPFEIIAASSLSRIKFSLSPSLSSICIYDINGRLVDRIKPIPGASKAYAVWPAGSGSGTGKIPAGRYFARVLYGKKSIVRPFLLVR